MPDKSGYVSVINNLIDCPGVRQAASLRERTFLRLD
jgi:hypothetical protein